MSAGGRRMEFHGNKITRLYRTPGRLPRGLPPEEMSMNRRSFLAGSATAALIRPSLAQPAVVGTAKTLTYVPQANLTSLDPVWTTALVTRNCAAMIFETLYGRDE